jgi:protein TonB
VFVDSRRMLTGGFIALTHVLALYGLATGMQRVDASANNIAPIAVDFIATPQTPPDWKPPPVQVQPVMLANVPPDAPVFETEPSEHAITPVVAPAPSAPQPVQAAPKFISTVEYLREPAPRYPPQSKRLREQGVVVLRVVIDEHGAAASIQIETSSGHARLDDAARDAVARATFRPYVEDGAPRRALVLIPIEFALNQSSA